MKAKTLILVVISFLILSLIGCVPQRSTISADDIAVGVIETKGTEAKSRIIFFNANMDEIGELPLDYATVGSIFSSPIVRNDKLYIIPQGIANKRDEKKVLEVELANLVINQFTIDQIAMNDVAVNDTSIYTCNNLNGVSFINRCNIANDAVESVEIPDTYISSLICVEDYIYAFGTCSGENGFMSSFLYIYDNELSQIEQIEITEYGTNQYKSVEYEDVIYFTSCSDSYDRPTASVSVFDIKEKTFETIELGQINPWELIVYQNKLYISCFDAIQRIGGRLCIYDLETKEMTHFSLSHGAEQMVISEGYIYFLSDWTIYMYDLRNMELIKSVKVDNMDSSFSYLSGMFAIK